MSLPSPKKVLDPLGVFGGDKAPAPVIVQAPAGESDAVRRERLATERELDRKARGRASLLAAGGEEAESAQLDRGLLKSQRRSRVAAEVLG